MVSISEKNMSKIRVKDVRLVLEDVMRVDDKLILSDKLALIMARKLKKVEKFLEGLDDD